MTILRKALACLLLALPGIVHADMAHADMTGVYGVPGTEQRMTMIIAANGDIRAEIGDPSMYWVIHQGIGYYIQKRPDGPRVSRVDDIAAVTRAEIDKRDPAERAEMAAHASVQTLIRKGTMTVGGRTGEAWFMQASDGSLPPTPWVVISHDPALAPLGQAMAQQFSLSALMDAYAIAGQGGAFDKAEAVLRSGTPILFAGAQLLSTSDTPVAPAEFALPAPPETQDQIRQWLVLRSH